MASAEQDPCFDHVVTYQECLLSMECVDPFEDCEAPRDLPRMSGEPICESFDNAYARCTCEHRYDGETGGTGGTGGTGTSQTAIALCDEMCGWPDECFVALGVPLQGAECTEECLASVEVVGVDCLGAIVDTVDCIGTCDVESITEEQALACQDESEAVSLACE